MDSQQEFAIREAITEALRHLAPGHQVVRIWGRLPGATPEQGQEGNAWATDVEDIADLAVAAMRQASDLH